MLNKKPNVDHVLMRAKDLIIIGTAMFALIKWLYINPIQVQNQVEQQQKVLSSILEKVDRIERKIFRERSN